MSKTALAAAVRQISRFAMIGFLSNLAGYLVYLFVTWFWLDPKIAVTLMYPCGAAMSYYGHAKYSFESKCRPSSAFARYVFAHLIGYGMNVLLLYLLVDKLGYPHQLVQLAAIFFVAAVLYLLFRLFVFPVRDETGRHEV